MEVCYVLNNSKEPGGSQVLVSTAAILRDLRGNAPLIPEEEKGTFSATAPEVDSSTHSSPTPPNAVVDELPPLPEIWSEPLQPSTSGSAASPNHLAENPVATRHEGIPIMFSRANTPSELPSLPVIKSQRILDQIFTHRSLVRRPKRPFEGSPSDANRDNEQ